MSSTVLVTGANRGIGLSLCQHYKDQGFTVYGVCRSPTAELEQTADVVIDGIDIGKADDCGKLFDQMSNVSVDVLINNAGILINQNLGQIDFNVLEQQFQVNAMGALRVTEGLLDNLGNAAKVAIITSRMGSIADNGSGGSYGYRMSKAALNAAGKSLAIDLKPKGISVAILHPGLVGTEMIGGKGDLTPDQAAKQLATRIDELNIGNSGTFWHSNGEILPW